MLSQTTARSPADSDYPSPDGTINSATGDVSFSVNFQAAPKLETVATYLALFIVAEYVLRTSERLESEDS